MTVPREGTERSNQVSGRLKAERITAVIFLLVSCWVGLRAESLVTVSSMHRSGTLPAHGALWLAAAVMGISSLCWCIQSFRKTSAPDVGDVGPASEALIAFAIMMLGAWLITWLGLLLAAGVTYLVLMLFYRDRGWLLMAVSSVGYLALIYYGLGVALRVPLPTSTIFPIPF